MLIRKKLALFSLGIPVIFLDYLGICLIFFNKSGSETNRNKLNINFRVESVSYIVMFCERLSVLVSARA